MRAGCFGKLPIHSDFIQHNAGGAEIETLYKWFQEGMETVRQRWGNDWESEYRAAPPTRFLFHHPRTKNLFVGVWLSGSDREGSPHPFLLWAQVDDVSLGEDAPLAPLLFWNFLRKAEEVAVGGWTGVSLETFLFRVDDLAYSTDLSAAAEKYRTYLGRKMSNDIWSAIFGSFDDDRKYSLVHNLVKSLGGPDGAPPALPLRLPLAPAVIASFWIDLSLSVARWNSLPTLTAWNTNNLSLLSGELDGRHFLPMIRPDLAHELGCDLVRVGRDDEAALREAREKTSAALDDPALPLFKLIERITENAVPPAPVPQPEPEPVEQPAAVSILKPVSQPVPEPVLKPVSQPVPEPVLKPVSQPAPEPVLKPVSQTVPTPAPAEQPATTPGEDDGTDIHIAPRSQGLLRASRFPHACYGKLPIFGDFIRDRNNLPEIHAMDIWFQEGILAARQFDRNWDAGFTNAPTSRFLYASPDSRNVIAGVWVASVDKAGRRYPFLIYTIAPAQELGSLPQLYPLYFSDFFHHAQELAEKGWKGQDLRTFGAKVEALSWHQDFDAGRAKYQEYLMKQKAGDLWKRLFGAADHPATMLLPLNLQSALLPMRTGSAGGMKTVLRFPRRKGVEPTLLVDLAMRMSGRTQHPTLVTWTDESLTILYPKLSPKFYALLMQPALAGEAVSDLAKDGADDAGFLQRARERFGAVATNPNITLGQLLQGLTGR